jgi:hypothetical protein
MDEDSQPLDVAATLARAGMDVRRSGLERNDGTTDEQQLAFAASRGWVIYTSNVRDFDILHRAWLNAGRSHSGIIYRTRQRWSVGEQARRIERIWRALSAEDMVNRYESLGQWGEDTAIPVTSSRNALPARQQVSISPHTIAAPLKEADHGEEDRYRTAARRPRQAQRDRPHHR